MAVNGKLVIMYTEGLYLPHHPVVLCSFSIKVRLIDNFPLPCGWATARQEPPEPKEETNVENHTFY